MKRIEEYQRLEGGYYPTSETSMAHYGFERPRHLEQWPQSLNDEVEFLKAIGDREYKSKGRVAPLIPKEDVFLHFPGSLYCILSKTDESTPTLKSDAFEHIIRRMPSGLL